MNFILYSLTYCGLYKISALKRTPTAVIKWGD
jgi:hypothetical protein